MTKRAIWFAIILLACGPAAFGGQGSGISNTFGIDNTVRDTQARPSHVTARSPYTLDAPQRRGQLHSHRISDFSSDSISSDSLALLYVSHGYDFLAQTEHHFKLNNGAISPGSVLGGWAGWVPRSVELTYGSRGARDGHVLALGLAPDTATGDLLYDNGGGNVADNLSKRIRNVMIHGGLAFVAHPDSRGHGVLPDYYVTVDELRAICCEAKPDAISMYHFTSNSEAKIDALLETYGQPVWSYAEDDYHPDRLSEGLVASTWISVPCNTVSWDAPGGIREQIVNGDYYIAWMSKGWNLTGSPPTLHVTADNSGTYPSLHAEVQNLGAWSTTLHFKVSRGRGSYDYYSGSDYNCDGTETYVRVQADVNCGWGRRIYLRSQPIWMDPSDTGGSPHPSSGMARLPSSSPDLQLRYLSGPEKPLAPPSGYIGHAFGVSTADGQVPPGATLELSYDGEDLSALGGTQYLAIYHYDDTVSSWLKVGGTVDPGTQTIESAITALGKYCISADLPVDTTAPQVFIDNPTDGGVVSTDMTLKATVNDDLGAWRVRFYLNDHLVGEDTSGMDGWSADIKIADYCAGNWTLKAVAEDLAGNEGSVAIPIYIASLTPLPTVTIASPASGATLSGTVTASGTCGDDVAVAAVTLKLDDTVVGYGDVNGSNWTCQIDTSYLVDGSRTLTATVEDYPGNTASASRTVTVNSGAPAYAPGKAKTLNDGDSIRVGNAVVVALPALTGDGYYVESADRGSGIRVRTGKALSLGDKVSLVGTVNASGAERAVEAFDVGVASSGNIVKPLGTSAKYLFKTPDSLGKIVKMWGTLGAIDSSSPAKWFILKDPSGIDVKCSLGDGVTIDPAWTLISVIGVVSGGQASPALLVRQTVDIKNLMGP